MLIVHRAVLVISPDSQKRRRVIFVKYYSTQRPIMPGCCPRDGVLDVCNFDKRQFCEEIGRDAWGYVEFNRELTPEELSDYELVSADSKQYYGVVSTFYDDGRVVSKLVDIVRAASKPEDSYRECRNKDIYVNWFETEEEAMRHVNDAKNA